jgi:glycerol kinase
MQRQQYVLSIDAGTTGVRAIAYTLPDFTPTASSYTEIHVSTPQPGWVEQDPTEIADSVTRVVRETTSAMERGPEAIGITNQRETVLLVERATGRPLTPAIVWQDRRTAAELARITSEDAAMIRATTGLVPDPYFSASKIAWLLRNHTAAASDVWALTVDSWVLYQLAGPDSGPATDWSNASRTLLFDIGRGCYSEELSELFGVPLEVLPQPMPSDSLFGVVCSDFASSTGLPEGTPVRAVLGDQQASMFGMSCVRVGTAKATFGTGTFLLVNAGHQRPQAPDGLLVTVAWRLREDVGPVYAVEGSVLASGAAIQWLRDGLGVIGRSEDLEPLAARAESPAGAIFVPAIAGLGSPWWDPTARGAIVGISEAFDRASLARATVSALAFQAADCLGRARESGLEVGDLRVDGGASKMALLCQEVADLAGVRVRRAAHPDATARGAAMMAALSAGLVESADLEALFSSDLTCLPSSQPAIRDRYPDWLRALEKARGWSEAPAQGPGEGPAGQP